MLFSCLFPHIWNRAELVKDKHKGIGPGSYFVCPTLSRVKATVQCSSSHSWLCAAVFVHVSQNKFRDVLSLDYLFNEFFAVKSLHRTRSNVDTDDDHPIRTRIFSSADSHFRWQVLMPLPQGIVGKIVLGGDTFGSPRVLWNHFGGGGTNLIF